MSDSDSPGRITPATNEKGQKYDKEFCILIYRFGVFSGFESFVTILELSIVDLDGLVL